MSNLKNLIKQNINSEVNSQKLSTSVATVVDIDNTNMLATIQLTNPFGTGLITLRKVPIVLASNAIIANTISVGDKVVVEFISSSLSACKIVGINYTSYSNIRKNARHVNEDLDLTIENHEINKSVNVMDLLFDTNEELNKFSTTYNYYEEYSNIADNLIGMYEEHDIGITHPNNKSTIKLKSDGAILISNGINSNISIDPDGNINMYGKNINILTPGSFIINGKKV